MGCLGLVATPIGNLGDMTQRAIVWLKAADLIACEDTRVSLRLLRHFGIEKPLLSYHDHNAERMRPKILERLGEGERVALVSDAGTPLVNDPGYKLVVEAIGSGIPVTILPGPSAVIAGLLLSGLPTDRFLFAGFLPPKSAARRRELAELAGIRATLILFETAPRLAASLADMNSILGNRQASVSREITKMFEETRRGTLSEMAAHYASSARPRGEIVVVIGPPAEEAPESIDLDRHLAQALRLGSLKDAVAAVSAATGLPRRQVYERALALGKRPAP